MTVEKEDLEENKTFNSTDDAQGEQKELQEIEITTITEEPSTTTSRPSRGRGRGRVRRPSN